MVVPVLETARLTLRGHTVRDFADSAAMWADPRVTQHIGGHPSTREESWSRVLRYPGHWALLGFGYWVVREKGSDRFVGEVGFADFQRDVAPPLDGMPEGGWVLAPWSHGRGYATEAVRAAHAWHAATFGPTTTACLIDPDNTASLRVAAKHGYRERSRTTYKGGPTIVLVRDAATPLLPATPTGTP